LAAEKGHAELLKLFINEFKVSPPQALSIALKDTPLSRCGTSGSWDCFGSYSYYESHPNIAQIFSLIRDECDFNQSC